MKTVTGCAKKTREDAIYYAAKSNKGHMTHCYELERLILVPYEEDVGRLAAWYGATYPRRKRREWHAEAMTLNELRGFVYGPFCSGLVIFDVDTNPWTFYVIED